MISGNLIISNKNSPQVACRPASSWSGFDSRCRCDDPAGRPRDSRRYRHGDDGRSAASPLCKLIQRYFNALFHPSKPTDFNASRLSSYNGRSGKIYFKVVGND